MTPGSTASTPSFPSLREGEKSLPKSVWVQPWKVQPYHGSRVLARVAKVEDSSLEKGMNSLSGYFRERNKNEISPSQSWMRHRESIGLDDKVLGKKDIDVDGTRPLPLVGLAAKFPFYRLNLAQ